MLQFVEIRSICSKNKIFFFIKFVYVLKIDIHCGIEPEPITRNVLKWKLMFHWTVCAIIYCMFVSSTVLS